MRINKNSIYKVEWLDITGHNHRAVKESNLTNCWTIGYLEETETEYIVKYGGNEDGEYCFDAIPKGVVTKIIKL